MNVLAWIGGIGATLYLVYAFIMRTRAAAVLASIRQQDRAKEAAELARLTQEVKDAKINYKHARDDYDSSVRGDHPG